VTSESGLAVALALSGAILCLVFVAVGLHVYRRTESTRAAILTAPALGLVAAALVIGVWIANN